MADSEYKKPKIRNHGEVGSMEFSAHPTDTYDIEQHPETGGLIIKRNIHRPIQKPVHLGKPAEGEVLPTAFHQEPQGPVFKGEKSIRQNPKTGVWEEE